MISGGKRYPWQLGDWLGIGLLCQLRPQLDCAILWLKVTTVLTVLIASVAIERGVIPGVLVILGLLCLPVVFNRLTARPGRTPSPQSDRSVAIASLMYCSVVLCHSLWS